MQYEIQRFHIPTGVGIAGDASFLSAPRMRMDFTEMLVRSGRFPG